MRDHSYRGKDSETGQWVYGDLITIKPPAIIPVLSDYKYPCIWNTTGIWPVDPDTVGQFTGLKDKDGVDIYEGSEVRAWSRGIDRHFNQTDELMDEESGTVYFDTDLLGWAIDTGKPQPTPMGHKDIFELIN